MQMWSDHRLWLTFRLQTGSEALPIFFTLAQRPLRKDSPGLPWLPYPASMPEPSQDSIALSTLGIVVEYISDSLLVFWESVSSSSGSLTSFILPDFLG